MAQELLKWAMERLVAIFRKNAELSGDAMREGIVKKFPIAESGVIEYVADKNLWLKKCPSNN